MPFDDPAQHLRDMLEYIGHIEHELRITTYDSYLNDRKTSAAMERYLQIITEAAYRLRDDAERVCPGPDWRRWRDLGNIIRHAYDRVDPTIIWQTIQNDMPKLKLEVQGALQRLNQQSR